MNPFAAAEERALRTYLHSLDIEEWEAERERLGLPHPCEGCEVYCEPGCKFYKVKR